MKPWEHNKCISEQLKRSERDPAMLSTSKKTRDMRQLFSGLTLGLAAIAVAITIVLLAPAAHAMSAIGTSTEQDFLPDGRMYVLRYSERAFTARQDVTFGLSVKATPTDNNRALPAFNAGGLDAETLRLDARSQYLLDPHTISAQLTYLRKTPTNTAADWTASTPLTNATEMINSLRKKFTYVYQGQFGASVAFFQRSGTTYELFWTPAQNIRVGAQYSASRKSNDSSLKPGDNNTWFGYIGVTY